MSEPTSLLPRAVAPVPAHAPASGHAHGHDHHHGHDHAGHRHDHATLPALRTERADPPRLSLMALSAGQRLVLALPLVALLWALAFWAMRDV
ncbi:MAG: hypothetical protein ACOVOC_05745 [Rhabdaerophilum sp.]